MSFNPTPRLWGERKLFTIEGGIYSHLKNVLFANVFSHFANTLGQFSKRFLLINGVEKELCTCVSDFFLSWLRERGLCVKLISFSCAAKMVMPWD